MELAYSTPILLPPTAPLRLTPKSPRTPSFPTHVSSNAGYILPVPVVFFPSSSSVRRAASNPGRAQTPLPDKRMKSKSVLQQTGAFPREDIRAVVTSEVPITTPNVRQGHVGGKLSGRPSGLVSLPKGRTTGSTESGFRTDISTPSYSPSSPKISPSVREASLEDSMSSAGPTTRAMSPTPTRRRCPFTSGAFWPRASRKNYPDASESPSSSSDSSLSSEKTPCIVVKKPVLPRRGILKNKEVSSHQRSISAPLSTYPATFNTPTSPIHALSQAKAVTFAPDVRPVINVTLPARYSNPSVITDNQQCREGERARAMSELLKELFVLSSGNNSGGSVSSSTTNEHLDVPGIAIEHEDEFDVNEVASRGSPSLETSGGNLDLLSLSHLSQSSTHRLSSPAPFIFTKSFQWTPEEAQVDRTLQTKRSSSALPQVTREANVVKLVAPVTQMPSPPATPVPEKISHVEEEFDDDTFDVRDIRTSEDGKLDVSTLSDDEWTLRAESIDDGSVGQKLDGNLPRYSELLYSPTDTLFDEKEALISQFTVEKKPKPGIGLVDEDFTIERALYESSHTVRYPPVRSTSQALPAARRLRSVPRTELLVERASQQWDREKVNDDVQKVAQRLCWDKVQNAWHLVREAEHPVAGEQIVNTPQEHGFPRNSLSFAQPTMVKNGAILPPGRLEWATVDSASSNPTVQHGLVFRLCIAWRLATQYNVINHPFGAKEEIKVFALERTHEEFYQFYEGLMRRFMLEPQRHPLVKSEEVGPRARASLPLMEPPMDHNESDSTIDGNAGNRVQETRRKVDMLESWTQGFMKLKGTRMGFVLESDYVRMWMAPHREGDCERSPDNWRKDGHGEIGQDSEVIARVLERLW